MNLSDLYKAEGAKALQALAVAVNANPQFLYQVATGRRRAGPHLVNKLVKIDPRLTREEMRPDIFGTDEDAA